MSATTLQDIKPNKIFIINRSDIEERLDPSFYSLHYRLNNDKINNSTTKPIKFREIIEEFSGGPMGFHLHTYDYTEAGIPILRIGNLNEMYLNKDDNFIYVSEEKHNELKNSKVKENDLIFSKAGKVGEMSIVPVGFGEANLNQALSRIRIKPTVNTEFVYLFFKSNIGSLQIKRYGSGRAVQDDLKMSEIEHFKIILPPINIQNEIVEYYKKEIKNANQKEAQAKELLQSIDTYILNELGITLPQKNNSLQSRIFTTNFSEVVGLRLDPDYQKLSYKDLIKAINNSKVEVQNLKSVTEVLNAGKTPASSEYSETPTAFPIIKVGSYSKDFIDLSKVDYANSKQRLIAKKGDIFILSAAHQSEYVGKHIKQLIDEPEIPTSYVGELICVRANNKIEPVYLFSLLNSDLYKTLINREKTGQTSHVYGKDLKAIPIPLPPLATQTKIVNHINQLHQQIKQLQADAIAILENAKAEVEKMILN